jgi:hypothetical protein
VKKILFLIPLLFAIVISLGCTQPIPQPMPGSDRDAHGCIPSAGYSWCDAKQKCIRPWEEDCNAPMVGNDRDEHGCIGSAGYTWCEPKQKCLRTWEEDCNEAMPGSDMDSHGCIPSAGYSWCEPKQKCLQVWEEPCTDADREAIAEKYCTRENVAQVSTCGNYIKVVSSLIGGGSTFYTDDGNSTVCPVVSPDAMSNQCRLYIMGSNCIEKIICDNTVS